MQLLDKTNRPIAPGDVLKVFHFIGARRKRHYMYKQAVAYLDLPNSEVPYLKISHLNNPTNKKEDAIGATYYIERADGRVLPDYEIVQSKEGV